MDRNKDFKKYYNKYSVSYSKYLFFTIIGSFWGLNKMLIKDFKTCYDRLVFGSISAIISILFFYFYIVFVDTLSLFKGISFEDIEHLKQLIFAFFLPIFFIIVCSFVCNLLKDLIESRKEIVRYNHSIKKLILKGNIDKLESLYEINDRTYKKLFNCGSIFGTYNAYYGNKKKHFISCILPSLASMLLIINLFVDLFCAIMYLMYFLTVNEVIFGLYTISANISMSILSFLLFNLVPLWLIFNLLILCTDYKKIKSIKVEKRF